MKCDCLNDCGDDPRIQTGKVAPCVAYAATRVAPADAAADVQHGMRLARDCAHKLANEANWHSLEAHLRKMAGLRDEDRKS